MEYDILYLLKGEAAAYQQSKVRELAKRFDEPYLLEKKRPAHVTLKYHFPAKDISEIEEILKKLIKNRKAPPAKIRGYITFRNRVICLKVIFSKEANRFYDELRRELEKVEWLQWKKEDNIKGKFHSAIIFTFSLRKFRQVQAYLDKERPEFDMALDTIIIRKRVRKNAKWRVHKIYKIKGIKPTSEPKA